MAHFAFLPDPTMVILGMGGCFIPSPTTAHDIARVFAVQIGDKGYEVDTVAGMYTTMK